LKICIVTQQFGQLWSGVGTYALNLVKGLQQRNIEVEVICPEGLGSESEKVCLHKVSLQGWERKINYWLPLAWKFAALIKQQKFYSRFDIIHFTDARESLFTPPGITVVGMVNDYYPITCPLNPLALKPDYSDWLMRWLYWRFIRVLEPMAYRKLDAVAVNSNFIAQELIKKYSLSRNNIEIINMGIDYFLSDKAIKLVGEPSILFVGSNFQRKGLPVLIRAMSEVKKHYPGVMLHVVGADTKIDIMKALASERGIASQVLFLGPKPNEEVRRMRSSIFAMPSLIEGFGIVFLEMMMAGIPVIGGRTGGTVELITDGYNGFLVEPGDVIELADKILSLANNQILREKFITTGKETVLQYTTDQMVERTITLYRKVINDQSRS
jgi:glycosyltransferase involved in cell wall biosynthesis